MVRKFYFAIALTISFASYGQDSQVINLRQGWSIFSTCIQPTTPDFVSVMSPVISEVIIIKDDVGNVYWPQNGVNTMGNLLVGKGYCIKMSTAQNLTISGTQVAYYTPVSLPQGWSIMGYMRQNQSSADSSLSGILNHMIIIQDDSGKINWPNFNVHQLTYLKPGKGYRIKMLTAQSLVYPYMCGVDNVMDYDNNIYHSVQIGNQCWMKENMKTKHYSNGTLIPAGSGYVNITGNYNVKYWFAPNNQVSNIATYGLLYTWAAVTNGTTGVGAQGICPTGWHVPSGTEWTTLINYLGGASVAGGSLKEAGTDHWISPNTGATNSSGFSALPSGFRFDDGSYSSFGNLGLFWTTTNSGTTSAWAHLLSNSDTSEYSAGNDKAYSLSVRCLKN